MRSLWNSLIDAWSPRAADAAPARENYRPQFERLETRENPAGQADAIVWGGGWQEYHVGADDHFHIQYSANGGAPQSVDLTAALGSTATFSSNFAAVTATTFGNSPYVFARAQDSHIHAFYWTGAKWAEANLSAAAGYNKAAQPYQIAAHVWNGIPHVFFVGNSDKHVHELYWSAATGWKGVDLTGAAGSFALAEASAPIAALIGSSNTEHVYYQDSNNNLREMKWTANTGWKDASIIGAGQKMATSAQELSAFSIGSTRFVFYQGTNNHIYQMSTSGASWVSTDLTNEAVGGVTARAFSDLQAYYRNGCVTVAFVGANHHVYNYTCGLNVEWECNDLTLDAGAGTPVVHGVSPPTFGGALTSLIHNNTEILFYVNSVNRMDRLYTTDPLQGWNHALGTPY